MHVWTIYSLTCCSCLFIVSSLIWLMDYAVFFARCWAYFTWKFMYCIYLHTSQFAYKSTPSMDIKKCPKVDTWVWVNAGAGPSSPGCWGFCSYRTPGSGTGSGGVQAMPRRPPTMRRWRPVGGWSAGMAASQHHRQWASLLADRRKCVRRKLGVIRRRRHRPGLPAFGQHFATTISHQLAQAALQKLMTKWRHAYKSTPVCGLMAISHRLPSSSSPSSSAAIIHRCPCPPPLSVSKEIRKQLIHVMQNT